MLNIWKFLNPQPTRLSAVAVAGHTEALVGVANKHPSRINLILVLVLAEPTLTNLAPNDQPPPLVWPAKFVVVKITGL